MSFRDKLISIVNSKNNFDKFKEENADVIDAIKNACIKNAHKGEQYTFIYVKDVSNLSLLMQYLQEELKLTVNIVNSDTKCIILFVSWK